MYKVLILGDASYANAFDTDWFITRTLNWHGHGGPDIESYVEDCNLICFTGGEDVHPQMYGCEVEAGQQAFMFDESRDFSERKWWKYAKHKETPCVGICRGAQLLNVLNGGILVQDVENHDTSHLAYSYTDFEEHSLTVSSDHHNMMIPHAEQAELLLFSLEGEGYAPLGIYDLLPRHPDGSMRVDPEVVLYRAKKDLCHQPHPEWQEPTSAYWKYFNHTVRRLLEL